MFTENVMKDNQDALEHWKNAYKWGPAVESGEQIVEGVNKFASNQRTQVRAFEINLAVEDTAIERIRRYKAQRDDARTQTALGNLRNVAAIIKDKWPDGGAMMPALLNAARAKATKGEMMDILRSVFGWGYSL